MSFSVLKAIHDRFESSATLSTSIVGGLWTSAVPERPELPYASVSHDGTMYEHVMGSGRKRIEITRVTFCIYHNSMLDLEDLSLDLIDHFDGPDVLSFNSSSGRSLMYVRPDGYRINSDPGRYEDGSQIYHSTVSFEIQVSKQ